jgi:hypothetical protein
MKSSRRKILLLALAVFGLSCFAFGREFLRCGARSGFVFSWIGFVAAGTLTVATTFRRWQSWIAAVALAGLAGPAIALVLISGAEASFLTPDSELFRGLSSLMAVLWYPGNWVSSFFGMEVRLSDLHLTPRDELYEWLRLVPLNVLVYGLVGVIARAAVAHSPFRRSG